MKYNLVCIDPTFTFLICGDWKKTKRGIELLHRTYTDINLAHQEMAHRNNNAYPIRSYFYQVDEAE